jgi:hypothetical protein
MAEPLVFDARNGLQPEALQELAAADRVTVAFKDTRTAVLGYWHRRAGLDDSEQMGVVVVPSNRARVPLPPGKVADQVVGWWLRADIRQAQENPRWQRILSMLRPGDSLCVGRDRASGRYQLELWVEDQLLAAFSLASFAARQPRARRAQQTAP